MLATSLITIVAVSSSSITHGPGRQWPVSPGSRESVSSWQVRPWGSNILIPQSDVSAGNLALKGRHPGSLWSWGGTGPGDEGKGQEEGEDGGPHSHSHSPHATHCPAHGSVHCTLDPGGPPIWNRLQNKMREYDIPDLSRLCGLCAPCWLWWSVWS